MEYKALALQICCDAINACEKRSQADDSMFASISKINKQIQASKKFIGQDLKLVVLPEYFLTGFPMDEHLTEWQEKACLHKNSKQWQELATIAIENDIFLSGNVYELDENFPSLYFQASFIFSPAGVKILNYRRLISMFTPTPHDVWDSYLSLYSYESVFPVADTEIGKLACIASEEILYPEIARCLFMKGAEVLLHSSSEISSPLLTQKNIAKQARAIENMAYVVSANSAGIRGIDIPFASTDGSSKIVQYEGIVLSEAGAGESMVASATIHLSALRHSRARVGMPNIAARQRFELFAESYARNAIYPVNTLLNQKPHKKIFLENIRKGIENLKLP